MSSPAPAEFTRSQLAVWCMGVLAAACALAWFPSLQPPILVAEDHAFLDLYKYGYAAGIGRSSNWQGVWRVFGFSLVGFTTNLHPLAYPVLAFLTHLATVSVFASTCSRLLGNRRVALGLGLVMATLPLGYQALVWGACYPFILASLLFWAQVWVVVSYGTRVDRQNSVFVVVALLTLLGTLSNECLLGASLMTSVWFWLPERTFSLRGLWRNMVTYYAGWAPLAGAALYVAAYYGFRPEFAVKQPGIFNPRSLLSAYYHATSALRLFGVWTSPLLRDLGFESWSARATILAIALAALLVLLLRHGVRRFPVRDRGLANPLRVGATIGCLLFGTSLIYAIGGAFSPESRKLYPICYVMALAAGFFLVRFAGNWLARPTVFLLVVACCIPTVWLLTGVWRFEAGRGQALARTLAENDVHSPFEIRSDTEPYKEWPYLITSYGFRMHDLWVLNYTLAFTFPEHGADLRQDATGTPTVVRYERNRGWSVVRTGAVSPM